MFIVCSVSFGTGLRVESPSELDRSMELINDTAYALWEDSPDQHSNSSNLDHDNFNDEDLQSSGLPSGTPSASSAYGSPSVEPLALAHDSPIVEPPNAPSTYDSSRIGCTTDRMDIG